MKPIRMISALAAAAAALGTAAGALAVGQTEQAPPPYKGFLAAHKDAPPQELLGGPIDVTVEQTGGTVFVALPDKRELDPHVFGTPTQPRAFAGTPGVNAVPVGARTETDGSFGRFDKLSPFGDKHITMKGVGLTLSLHDATAIDAKSTNDSAQMTATWQDSQGNTYEVVCCKKMAAHGVEYPTFGGVVTNSLMHGSTRVGTALMPTLMNYAAFWGIGEVRKNGETLEKPQLVHGMLTEYVRGQGYVLQDDAGVDPTRRHFHLMVPPFDPNPDAGAFKHDAVDTGFTLPNDKTLPFWHVMFEQLEISADRGEG